MTSQTSSAALDFAWRPQPEAAALVAEILRDHRRDCPPIRDFADQLLSATGTRLLDWVDHVALPAEEAWEARLVALGFSPLPDQPYFWTHPEAELPRIALHDNGVRRVAIRVDSVVDFLVMHRLHQTPIEGPPLARLRRARIAAESGTELWIVERHGDRGWQPCGLSQETIEAMLRHLESFRRRRRRFEIEREGFRHAVELIRSAAEDLGTDRTCDLFFAAEREYWTMRNRAARVQKARQDALGLGWANHDHHTYRSSREHFASLIAVLEELGMECRERFYAGREAGWGAQVLEQPAAGVVVFADVDLAPEEVADDFAHQPLAPRESLGTVGLWCKLHGEAFLQAGMHHLECRFDFQAAREQLQKLGVPAMKPFTDLPYLKQAFTEGEVWAVEPQRVSALLAAGAITHEKAERFRQSGAIGSHLEILQRDEGYKGFNQAGINEIIRDTDPRHA